MTLEPDDAELYRTTNQSIWRPLYAAAWAEASFAVGVDADGVDHRFGPVDRDRGVRPLVRVDADHEHVVAPVLVGDGSPRWAHLIWG
jgi:hypothetical protein